jgi:hypothetical protein
VRGKSTVAIILTVILIAVGTTIFFITQFFEDNPTQPQPTGYITGVITDIDSEAKTTVLVIEGISVEEAKTLSVEEAMAAGENATWITMSLGQRSSLVLYDEVKVGYTALSESYPSQATAKTIEKLNE